MAEKKEKTIEKKKSSLWIWILIVAVIVIAVIIVFSARGCAPKPVEEINDTWEPEPDTQAPQKVYKTADDLTQITFTREASGQNGDITQHASFKLTGYMQEFDPVSNDLTMYSGRAFKLKDGRLQWDLRETYHYGSFDETINSSGSELISNLNVYWDHDGPVRDDQGNLVHMPIYDMLFAYNEQGTIEQGKSEFKIIGSGLLLPLTDVENGVSSIDTGILKFPIKFIGFNPDQKTFTNSFIAKEPYENEWQGTIISGYQDAIFAEMTTVMVTDIPVLGIDGPWTVNWTIEMPQYD